MFITFGLGRFRSCGGHLSPAPFFVLFTKNCLAIVMINDDNKLYTAQSAAVMRITRTQEQDNKYISVSLLAIAVS